MNDGFDELRSRVKLIRRCGDLEQLVASAKSDLKFGSVADARDELDALSGEVESVAGDVEEHLERGQEAEQ